MPALTLALALLLALPPRPLLAAERAPLAAPPLLVHAGQRLIVPAQSPLRERLSVAPVGEEANPDHIQLPAVVEADPGRSASVLPPFTGRLQRIRVRLGDHVVQGQTVAELSAPDLTQAFADLDKAREALALAGRVRDRARAVLAAGGSAAKDLEQADSAVVQAEAESKRASARLSALGLDPAGSAREPVVRLTAPISGTVTAMSSAAGGFLTDPTVALLTIANLDPIWVTAQVPEHLLAAVHPGQSVDVRLAAYPGETLHGRVASIAAVLDADTRRTRARIPVANPAGRLRPNMFATAVFAIAQARHVRIPLSALVMRNDSNTVFVEVAPWTFEARPVELGSEDEHGVTVLRGLRAGERVVTRGGVLLDD
jgi:cobalt-zinc-cadmium efflux system membrane fusion protein